MSANTVMAMMTSGRSLCSFLSVEFKYVYVSLWICRCDMCSRKWSLQLHSMGKRDDMIILAMDLFEFTNS